MSLHTVRDVRLVLWDNFVRIFNVHLAEPVVTDEGHFHAVFRPELAQISSKIVGLSGHIVASCQESLFSGTEDPSPMLCVGHGDHPSYPGLEAMCSRMQYNGEKEESFGEEPEV